MGNNLALVAPISQEWLVDDSYAAAMEAQLANMTLRDVIDAQRSWADQQLALLARDGASTSRPKPYQVSNGVAYVTIAGVMTKNPHCLQMLFGGTATKMVEAAMWQAAEDTDVKSILLRVDASPGGEVSGSFDLANAVKEIDKVKPVYGYAEDMAASAAYLVLSQCRFISGNVNSLLGSIGVYTQLVDSSKLDASVGIKRITVYSGKYKAIGAPGREISAEDLAHVQERVDNTMSLFMDYVSSGRNMDGKALAKVANGGVFMGKEAARLGLVDKIESLGSAHKRAANGPAPTGGMRGEDNMAQNAKQPFDIFGFRAWLNGHDDNAAAAPADGDEGGDQPPAGTEQAAATTPATAETAADQAGTSTTPTVSTELFAALQAAGADSVDGLASLVERATLGDDYTARMRTQVTALAVVALGQEMADSQETLIASADVVTLRKLGKGFEAIGVQKGLLTEDGQPVKRDSAANATDTGGSPDTSEGSTDSAVKEAKAKDELQATGLYSL